MLAIDQPGRVQSLTVSVDVAHPFASDLRVSLTSPQGRTIILQAEGTDGGQDLVRSYTATDTPALGPLVGVQAQGGWTLRVADLFRLGVGNFRRWSLQLEVG